MSEDGAVTEEVKLNLIGSDSVGVCVNVTLSKPTHYLERLTLALSKDGVEGLIFDINRAPDTTLTEYTRMTYGTIPITYKAFKFKDTW